MTNEPRDEPLPTVSAGLCDQDDVDEAVRRAAICYKIWVKEGYPAYCPMEARVIVRLANQLAESRSREAPREQERAQTLEDVASRCVIEGVLHGMGLTDEGYERNRARAEGFANHYVRHIPELHVPRSASRLDGYYEHGSRRWSTETASSPSPSSPGPSSGATKATDDEDELRSIPFEHRTLYPSQTRCQNCEHRYGDHAGVTRCLVEPSCDCRSFQPASSLSGDTTNG